MADRASLLYDLAHDLRNELAPVRSTLELLRAGGASGPGARDAPARIERALEAALATLDGFVAAGEWAFGAPAIAPAPVSLGDILGRALRELSPPLRERCTPPAAGATPEVAADLELSARVIATMIAHAAVAARPDEGLQLRTGAHDGGGTIAVTVPLEPGTPASAVADWLNDFRPRTGAGQLALRTARHIMERQHGELGLDTTQDECLLVAHFAATATLSATATPAVPAEAASSGALPAEVAASSDAATPAASEPARKSGAILKVLIVEDNPRVLRAYMEGLAGFGYTVSGAGTGAAALEAAAAASPDAVVIDIHLPDMDGFRLARLLRTRGGSAARLVMLSGVTRDEAVLAEAQRSGFDASVDKTAGPRALHAILRDVGLG